ncbi:MAG: helix-turn-helix domain-containing protein [Nanoarchaeota archaeon]
MEINLEELGLSRNEAKIYLYLLKNGERTTGPIIKETGIANSRVYESLNSLIEKGFVSYNVQKDGKHFKATNPKILIENEEERKKKVESLVPQLIRLMDKENNKEIVSAVYEGIEGFKTAFRKIIDDCPVKGEILIIGFSEQQHSQESLKTFLSNMNLKCKQKKQKLKFIFDNKAKNTLGKEREKEGFEVRYMPDGFISPAAIDIMGDYVYVFLWEEKPFVFMIKNQKIADSFRHYFNFLWGIAKK